MVSLRTSPQAGVAIRIPLVPNLDGKWYESDRDGKLPSKLRRATFLEGEGFGNGLPRQCAHWLAMTGRYWTYFA